MKFINNHAGNAVLLVLIGIILFAALSYAVTQSGRGTGNTDAEQARLKATEMIQWAGQIKNALQKVKSVNRCNIHNLSYDAVFGNPETHGGRCNVFDPSNSLTARYQFIADGDNSFYGDYSNPPAPGKIFSVGNQMHVAGAGPVVSGSVPTDIVMFMFNIRPEICVAINRISNVDMPDGDPVLEESPISGGYVNPKVNVNYTPANVIGLDSGGENELAGRQVGCYRANVGGSDMGYHFYYVLEAN